MDQTEKLILEAIDQHRDEIIEFARDIYDHGELGYKEFNTAEKFIKKMKDVHFDDRFHRSLLLLIYAARSGPVSCGTSGRPPASR